MPTMYEKIQGLPLFQGTSAEDISAFLEKTHVEFNNFQPGDTIAEIGEECTSLKFVLSGLVRCDVSIGGGALSMSSLLGPGAVLCAEHLFGMYTQSHINIIAETEGSYMQIRKNQYFKLLQSGSIYLLNYINYLSYHLQRARRALCMDCSIAAWIKSIRDGLADRHAKSVELRSTYTDLARLGHEDASKLKRQLESLQLSGDIILQGNLTIILK